MSLGEGKQQQGEGWEGLWGLGIDALRCMWKSRAGLLHREEAAPELEPDGCGVLSMSFGVSDCPGRLQHRQAVRGQSPRTYLSRVASWYHPAAFLEPLWFEHLARLHQPSSSIL